MINALGIKGNKVIGNTYSVPPRPPTSTPWVVISPGSGLSLFGLSASASPFHQSGKFSSILSHYKLGQIPNIHGARVIICWNTEWSRKFEQCIAHDLAILGADQVAFIPSPLLTTLASKQPSNTVLVINIGFRHVSVSPVCFGQIFTWAQTVLSSSFLDIFTDYADLPKSDIIESAIVEFVKKLGIYNVYEVRDYRESTREMPLKDNNGTSIKQISYGLMQVVLNDFMDDMCDIVLESLSRCPIDCRRPLSRSIALSGGMALIPGIQQKFMHCMSQKISNDPSRAYLRGSLNQVSQLNILNGLEVTDSYWLLYGQNGLNLDVVSVHSIANWCSSSISNDKRAVFRPPSQHNESTIAIDFVCEEIPGRGLQSCNFKIEMKLRGYRNKLFIL